MSEARLRCGRGTGGKAKHKSSLGQNNRRAIDRPQEQPGPSHWPASPWDSAIKQHDKSFPQVAAVLLQEQLPSEMGNTGVAPPAESSSLTQEQSRKLSSGATIMAGTQGSVPFSLRTLQELDVGPASLACGQPSCFSDVGQEEEEQEEDREVVHELSSRPTVPQVLVPASSAIALFSERVTHRICQMMALDTMPFSTVERVGFCQLLQTLCPWYEIPSSKELSDTVVPFLYQTTRDIVKRQLSRARTVHFTSDVWTCSQSQRAYLSLTAHWWQPEDTTDGPRSSVREGEAGCPVGYCHALLHSKVLDLDDAAVSLSGVVLHQMETWVSRNVARGFMMTNGGTIVSAAVRNLRLRHVQCTAHLLRLVVNEALGLTSSEQAGWDAATCELWRLLEHCQRIATHFNHSVEASWLLHEKREEANVPDDCLIDDLPTCGRSVYAMIQRMLEQRAALCLVAEVADLVPGERLTCTEWQMLSQMALVLKLFQDSAERLGCPTVGLGLVIPLLQLLQKKLASLSDPDRDSPQLLPPVAALVHKLQRGIEAHLQPLAQKTAYMLATLCDPRIKGSIALHTGTLPRWREELTQCVRNLQAERGIAVQVDTVEATVEDDMVQCAIKWAVSRSKRHRGEDQVEVMVTEYLAEPCESSDADPLSYWAQKEGVWPSLSRVAQELLSCPATRVESEWVFSHGHADTVFNSSDLLSSRVDEMVFLKVNLPFVNLPTLVLESE